MENRDLHNILNQWNQEQMMKAALEALDLLPKLAREDMIHIVDLAIEEANSGLGATIRSNFEICLCLLNDFIAISDIDPFTHALQYVNTMSEDSFSEWFNSIFIDPTDWIKEPNKIISNFCIWEESGYFENFLDKIKASCEDRAVIHKLIHALGHGLIEEMPTRIPECMLGPDVGKVAMVYLVAAEYQNLMEIALSNSVDSFNKYLCIIHSVGRQIEERYPDVVSDWKFFWRNNHLEVYKIAAEKLFCFHFTEESPSVQLCKEMVLLAVLHWSIISDNWYDYLFNYRLKEICHDVYSQMQFSRFLATHSDGERFKNLYSQFCIANGIEPLLPLTPGVCDEKNASKLWISPTIKNFQDLRFKDRYIKVSMLCDALKDWGAFGDDFDYNSVKSLFIYRLTGLAPSHPLTERIPWKKQKGELADLIYCLLSDYKGDRPPYTRMSRFFDIEVTNLAASKNSGSCITIESMVKENLLSKK